jgi:formylglycine-generating enzyme required for sulfatase activity
MHAIMSTCTVGSGGPPEHVGVTDEVEGLWDLSGNAWELTADVYLFGARSGCAIRDAADPLCIDGSGLRTVTAKGGGYLDSAEDQFRAAFTDVGFRCVYPVP